MSLITIFSCLFSVISILSTAFEFISSTLILNSETVVTIKLEIESAQLSALSLDDFNLIRNKKNPIQSEISKIIDIDSNLIELLKPQQTKDGLKLLFHIRTDSEADSHLITALIKNEIDNGKLATTLFEIWSALVVITNVPIIKNIETKELKPETNLKGQTSELAAVINMKSGQNVKQNVVQLPGHTHMSLQQHSLTNDSSSRAKMLVEECQNNGAHASAAYSSENYVPSVHVVMNASEENQMQGFDAIESKASILSEVASVSTVDSSLV